LLNGDDVIRKPWLLIFVLLLGITLIPGIIGFQIQRQFQALVRDLSSNIDIEIVEYERGLLNSYAITRLQFLLPETSQHWDLSVRHEIKHGPLLEDGVLYLARIRSIFLDHDDARIDQPTIELLTRVDMSATAIAQLDWDKVIFGSVKNAGELNLSQLKGGFLFDPLNKRAKIDVSVGRVSFTMNNTESWILSDFKWDSTHMKDISDVMLGDMRISVGKGLFLSASAMPKVEISEFIAEYKTVINESLLDYMLAFSATSLRINQRKYDEIESLMLLENLAPTVLKEMNRQLLRLPNGLDIETYQQMLMPILFQTLQGVVANDPLFAIKYLHVTTPDGDVDLNVSLQTEELVDINVVNLHKLVEYVVSTLSLKVPETIMHELVQIQIEQELWMSGQQYIGSDLEKNQAFKQQLQLQSAAKIQQLLKQKILLREGKFLTLNAELADGFLTLNNLLFPLPLLQ